MYQEADRIFEAKNPDSTPEKSKITVINDTITNERTLAVLDALGISPGYKSEYYPYRDPKIFQELGMTPNGNPLVFALEQHPEVFDHMKVDYIEVRAAPKEDGSNSCSYKMIQYASLDGKQRKE